jgi:hypothetical protein
MGSDTLGTRLRNLPKYNATPEVGTRRNFQSRDEYDKDSLNGFPGIVRAFCADHVDYA